MNSIPDISHKKSILIFSIALILVELIIYRDFIFGDYYFLFKDLGDDSYVSSYPSLYSKIESLKSGEIPSWNFSTGLGENNYPFWLEPIALSVTYLFFKNDIASAFIWIQLIYSFLAGIFFFLFLRGFKTHYLAATIASVLYVFSGYMLIHSSWMPLLFSNNLMLFAFLLYAWQKFIIDKNRSLLPIATLLLSISCTPVNLYFGALLIAIFMVLQFPIHYKKNWEKWSIDLLNLSLYGAIGIGLSSFMLLSNVDLMLNSPRGSGMYAATSVNSEVFASISELSTSLSRLFGPNIQGIADEYSGWSNYFEAPIWYAGMLVIILLPQLFHFLNKKEKLIYGGTIFFFILVALIPKFRLLLWFNTGNYYREISLLFAAIVLFMSAKALHLVITKKTFYKRTLLITLLMCLISLMVFSGDKNQIVYITIMILISYGILIWLGFKKSEYLTYGLPAVIITELLLVASPTMMERGIIKESDIQKGIGYQDYTIHSLSSISNQEIGFYRVEKGFFSGISRDASFNEAKIQGFKGSKTYNSFTNKHYINFLKLIEELDSDNETSTRWVYGISRSLNAMRLCSVKYFLTKGNLNNNLPEGFSFFDTHKNVTTLAIKSSLPFGFTYDTYIDRNAFKNLSKSVKQEIMLHAIPMDKNYISDQAPLKEISISENFTINPKDSLHITSHSNDYISGYIDSKKAQLLFFSIPFDEGWKLKIDNQLSDLFIVFDGLMATYVPQGRHKVELEFQDKYVFKGLIISLISLCIYLGIIMYPIVKRKINKQEKRNVKQA